MPPRFSLVFSLALSALLAGPQAVRADDLASAQRLWLAGQREKAVAQVEQAVTRAPDELRLRFALGVMRMELGQPLVAQGIFTALTQDFPDLADPYNNLAVLHAAAGELDLARGSLEQALRLQPDHAQAQENLGDVLLRLSLRAYERAQKANATPNPALSSKLRRTLSLTQELSPVRP